MRRILAVALPGDGCAGKGPLVAGHEARLRKAAAAPHTRSPYAGVGYPVRDGYLERKCCGAEACGWAAAVTDKRALLSTATTVRSS